jgi:DNA-binding response OmpR family regulator
LNRTSAKAELQKTKEQERQLFSDLSQKIRNLLTLITLPLEEIIPQEENKERRQYLDMALRNAYRMQTLVEKLLDLATADAGKPDVQVSFSEKDKQSAETNSSIANRHPKNAPLVLVVDDNVQIRKYLRRFLEKTYLIEEAGTGKQGLEKAIALVPDLVILDVIMPEMNGYELCATLKTTESTSHIPVIMLTAKSSSESKLYGYEQGADAYLPKPFNVYELQLQIKNFMRLREQFQKRFNEANRFASSDMAKYQPTSLENDFLNKLKDHIILNLSNHRYDVAALERDVTLSHVQLYRKLKALTGLSASEFIKHIRLEEAAERLRKNPDRVIEISFQVGFQNETYFSSCFKKQFQMTPTAFRKQSLLPR